MLGGIPQDAERLVRCPLNLRNFYPGVKFVPVLSDKHREAFGLQVRDF
jgi:hypothetical protein